MVASQYSCQFGHCHPLYNGWIQKNRALTLKKMALHASKLDTNNKSQVEQGMVAFETGRIFLHARKKTGCVEQPFVIVGVIVGTQTINKLLSQLITC